MLRFPRFSRLAAAGLLVVSALALGAAPAGAGGAASGSAASDQYYGTATITYAGTTKFEVYVIDGGGTGCEDTGSQPTTGILGTIGVDSPAPASPITVTTETLVGPAPAHALGTGSYFFCLYDVVSGVYTLLQPASTIPIFVPVSASMVDNGNGSLVVTYANADSDFSQIIYLGLFSGATSCPEEIDPYSTTGFAWQSGEGGNFPESPAAITVGTSGVVLPVPVGTLVPDLGPVTAGQYLACLYYTDVETSSVSLQQSLPVSIHTPVAPPTPPVFTG